MQPPRRLLAIPIATVALAAILTLTAQLAPPRATAATTGAGIAGLTPYGGYLGNYLAPDGQRVYCIDSSLAWPAGATSGPQLVDAIPTTWGDPLPASSLQKLNYVLQAHGQTDDPTRAAAVAAYVYAYTSGWARDLGPGYAAGAFYLNGNPAVTAIYDEIWADAEAHAIPVGTATVAITMTDSTSGVVDVSASLPAATGTLTLTGAVVAETGESSVSVSASQQVSIRGIPDDAVREYAVSAEVAYEAPAAAANLVLYATGDQQRTVRAGTLSTVAFAARAQTEHRQLDFVPVITTVVEQAVVSPGQAFVDLVTAGVAEDSRPWRVRTDGTAVPVIADGTLYGPFAEAPVHSDVVPHGAPVAGTETLLLTGPGTYGSAGSILAAAPGYYTWVWTIDAARQEPAARESLPRDYAVATPFGLPEETHQVPAPSEAPPSSPPAAAQLAATGSESVPLGMGAAALIVVGSMGIIGARRPARRGTSEAG